jgi:hypothetical protein
MVDYAATDEEREEIKKAVQQHSEYIEFEKQEVKDNEKFVDNLGKSYCGVIELYQEFERRNIEYITELGFDIGLMAKINERVKDGKTRQLTAYFIRLYGAEIEELYGEIEYYRKTTKEFQGLRGGGQGCNILRDESEDERQRGYYC